MTTTPEPPPTSPRPSAAPPHRHVAVSAPLGPAREPPGRSGRLAGDRLLRALFVLLLNAFWEKDAFTGTVEPFSWTLEAFEDIANNEVYRIVAIRTIGMASLVTVTDALLAFPIAYYMAGWPRRGSAGCSSSPCSCRCGRLSRQGLRLADDPPGQRLPRVGAHPFGIEAPGLDEISNAWLVLSPVAAVHDPADLRRPGADPVIASRRPRPTSEDGRG